jgi:mannose-6-phosphate isomerase-like protein (cupin superfamily)
MGVTLEGGCRVSQMREGEPIVQGTLRIWNRIGQKTGAQAISLRVMEFAAGMSPTISNDECDEILYVLDSSSRSPDHDREAVGDNSQVQAQSAPPLDQTQLEPVHREGVREKKHVATILIDGHSYDIGPDTGVYIRPNERYAIDNPGPDSIVIISSQCPDPDRAPRFVDAPMTKSSEPTASPLVRLADQKAQPTADRWYRVLVDEEIGSAQVTQFVGSIPLGRAPDHFHHYEEVLFILKGAGRMWAGETNTPIATGSCIYLPKGQVHCVENAVEGELRLLGVFYPAGSPSVRYDV